MAEAKAIKSTLTYYGSNSYNKVVLETDSLAMCNIIQKTQKIPWEFEDLDDDIYKLIEDAIIHVTHVHREANQLVDFIANITIEKEDKQVFTTFSQLPSHDQEDLGH